MLSTDPLDLELDSDNRLIIFDDGPHLIGGLAGVAQLVRIAIQLFRGEWFANLDAGMPWYQEILGKKLNDPLLRARLIQQISTVPAVAQVLSLRSEFDGPTRMVNVTCEIRVQFDDTDPTTITVATGISVGG